MKKPNVFAGHIEQDAKQSAENKANAVSPVKQHLRKVQSEIKKCSKLYSSARGFFDSSVISASAAEKAALGESIKILEAHLQKLRQIEIDLGGTTVAEQEARKQQKTKIDHDYAEFSKIIDQEIIEKVDPLKNEQQQLKVDLKKLKDEYMRRRAVLVERKAEVAQQKKALQSEIKAKRKAAKNARKNALAEVKNAPEKPVSPAVLITAEDVLTEVKTDTNRLQANLKAVLPAERDKALLQSIVRGKFEAPPVVQKPLLKVEQAPAENPVQNVQKAQQQPPPPNQEEVNRQPNNLPVEQNPDLQN
jgi:hypothetical protein